MTEEDKKAIKILNTILEKGQGQRVFLEEDLEYIRTILNLIQSQQEEIEKKDKIIDLILQDLMVCGRLDFIDIGKSNGNFKEDKQKLKQYFEKKVEGKQC